MTRREELEYVHPMREEHINYLTAFLFRLVQVNPGGRARLWRHQRNVLTELIKLIQKMIETDLIDKAQLPAITSILDRVTQHRDMLAVKVKNYLQRLEVSRKPDT